jgi:hypothetical protein
LISRLLEAKKDIEMKQKQNIYRRFSIPFGVFVTKIIKTGCEHGGI